MDQTEKQQWIDALRSDKYEQGEDYLCRGGKFCCLGVLCDIRGLDYKDKVGIGTGQPIRSYLTDFTDDWGDDYEEQDEAELPRALQEVLSLQSCGELPIDIIMDRDEDQVSLAELNDAGFTFDQIADVIEYAL